METEPRLMAGGLTETAAVTPKVQHIAQSLKPAEEEELKRKLDVYNAISFRSQVVAGINYFIKIVVGCGDDYIHVYDFEPLPQVKSKLSLEKLQCNKKLFNEIDHF